MARTLLNKILILDLESTCWEGDAPNGQVSEIIEIGWALLNIHTREIEKNGTVLVKPSKSKVSAFCTKLTTITQELLDSEGVEDQLTAFKQIQKEAGVKLKDILWASYGEYDRRMIERTITPYPMGRSHINIKTLAAVRLRLLHEVGMDQMLELLGIPLEGTHHRGGDDALNIAKIAREVL